MADGGKEANGLSSDIDATSDGDKDDESLTEMTGWLMKRSKRSHKWKRQWFHLKRTDLCYGETEQGTLKVIPLVASEIAESNVDSKAYAFRLRARNARRTYYMYAENGHELHDWMQAICFAKAAGNTRDSSQTCTLQ